MNKGISKSP